MNEIEINILKINDIINTEVPLYMFGAMSSKTNFSLLQILNRHNAKFTDIWDDNWLIINYSDEYKNLREEYKSYGYVIKSVPCDISSITQGNIIVAGEERYRRKWINYFKASSHMVYDAQDIIFEPIYEQCAEKNIGNSDLLENCRNCNASYRSCPVRRKWYESQYGMIKDKTIRHIAIKAGYICNLKCEYCCEYLPQFTDKQKKQFDADGVIRDIHKLSDSLEYINLLSLSGGDVMLNRDLAKVIHHIVEYKNIGDIYALTNGTYIPHKDVLDAIEENRDRVRIVINNYAINNEAEMLSAELMKRQITYHLRDNSGWYNMNNLISRNRSVNDLKELYRNCSFDRNYGFYYIMLEGKLNMRCGTANGILYFLNKYDDHAQDYIDIRKLTTQNIPIALSALEERDYLDICNFCVGCKEETRTIDAAEDQIVS